MTDRPGELPLPHWIKHGPLPPFLPQEEWTEDHRRHQVADSEFGLRARRSFDGHAYASWYAVTTYDFDLECFGRVYCLISGALPDDVLSAAAARGFVERHRETLAGGVVYAELLMSFIFLPPQRDVLRPCHCQARVWLGDTPLIRSALDRRYNIYDDAMDVTEEDRVLLSLAYGNANTFVRVVHEAAVAADIIARDRVRDRKIDHASLDARARSFGLDAKLAEARALADQIPFD
jgi:hypothetical protein